MIHSKHLEKLLYDWEGCKLHPYWDQGGKLTIGVGHLLTQSELISGKIGNIQWRDGIYPEDARYILGRDLEPADRLVCQIIEVELTQHQFDSLVSFVFNIGRNAFINSSLVRLLNGGDYQAVPEQLRRWNKVKVKGEYKVSQGLINRREKEIVLWEAES